MTCVSRFIAFCLHACTAFSLFGQAFTLTLDSTELEVEVLKTELEIPWDLNWAPDGWIWFNERNGTINRLNPQTRALQQVFQVPDVFQSSDNSGCHALALDPDFPQRPHVYLHYTYDPDTSRLVRYTYLPAENTLVNPLVLMDGILAAASHNGSRIVFSDDGSKLFLCMGDAYRGSTPQDLQYKNGKVLRINLDGSIPEDNPVPGNPAWTWGHRNPQGLVFGRGILYSSEHGGGEDDELNIIRKGENYGWPEVRGFCNWDIEIPFCADSGVMEPLMTWSPTYAPAGLAYYDHEAIPEWQHSLLLVFLKSGTGDLGQRMQQLSLNEAGDSVMAVTDFFTNTFGRLRDVVVAPDGRVFICTSNQETNGDAVVQADDDKIIEIRNPAVHTTRRAGNLPSLGTVSVFPNPAAGALNVQLLPVKGAVTLHLLDLLGRELWQESFRAQAAPMVVPRGKLPAGNYLLQVCKPGFAPHWQRVQFR